MYQDEYSDKIFSRRAFVIFGLQLCGLCILGARLAWLQIAQGNRYKMLSDQNRINIKILPPKRGQIVDRFGVPLAINTQSYRALIVPEQTKNLEQSLRSLQKLIILEEYHIDRVMKEAASSAKFVPLRIREGLTWSEVAKIEVNLPDLPGISVDRGEVRNYPYGQSTAHIVGYVRAVSENDLKDEARAKDPVFKIPGFKIGKTGIERLYDDKLRGSAGASEVEVNVIGREVRELKRKNPSDGERVTLSIDGELQRFTQNALAKHKSASAVIMDAHTGALYAMASHPSFDPNAFVRGLSSEEWEIIRDNPALPQTNKTLAGQYPPGSTFKMLTALAGLEAGMINKNTTVFCPGFYEFGKDRFHCWKKVGHGRMDLTHALSQSCDVFFYKMSTDVGIDKIAEMARRFGLGDRIAMDMPEEKPGLIPDKSWAKEKFGRNWQAGETIVSSIGQGSILTTPLQLAVMTARLVNGGTAVRPWVTGYVGEAFLASRNWKALGIPKDHLDMVIKGMNMAVNDRKGTAKASAIVEEGMEMGGKTGTAQVRRITREQRRLGVKNEDLPWEQRHHALFVGYAPISNPRYVCSVVVEHGVGGSTAAAPLARELLYEVQRRDPAATNIQNKLSKSEPRHSVQTKSKKETL